MVNGTQFQFVGLINKKALPVRLRNWEGYHREEIVTFYITLTGYLVMNIPSML